MSTLDGFMSGIPADDLAGLTFLHSGISVFNKLKIGNHQVLVTSAVSK